MGGCNRKVWGQCRVGSGWRCVGGYGPGEVAPRQIAPAPTSTPCSHGGTLADQSWRGETWEEIRRLVSHRHTSHFTHRSHISHRSFACEVLRRGEVPGGLAARRDQTIDHRVTHPFDRKCIHCRRSGARERSTRQGATGDLTLNRRRGVVCQGAAADCEVASWS